MVNQVGINIKELCIIKENKKKEEIIMLQFRINTTTNNGCDCGTNEECRISLFVVVLNNNCK